MLRDGLVVIRSGFERPGSTTVSDWRLPATYLALWCAAAEAGAGGDGGALLEECVPDPLLDHDLDAMGATLLDGLAIGAALVPASLTETWPRFGPALAPLVGWIERTTGLPGLTRRLTYAVELHLLEAGALVEPTALSLVIGTRVELQRPARCYLRQAWTWR